MRSNKGRNRVGNLNSQNRPKSPSPSRPGKFAKRTIHTQMLFCVIAGNLPFQAALPKAQSQKSIDPKSSSKSLDADWGAPPDFQCQILEVKVEFYLCMMCEADLCRVLLPRLSIDLHWGRVQQLYLHLINKHVCAIGGAQQIWRMQFCQKDLSPSLTSVACPTRCGSLRPTWKFHATWCEQRVLDEVSNSHYDTVGSALKHF